MNKETEKEKRMKRNEERDPINNNLDWFNFETKIRKLIQVNFIKKLLLYFKYFIFDRILYFVNKNNLEID